MKAFADWWADRKWPLLGFAAGLAAAAGSLLLVRPAPGGGILPADLWYAALLLVLPVLAGLGLDAAIHARLIRTIRFPDSPAALARARRRELGWAGDAADRGLGAAFQQTLAGLAGAARQAEEQSRHEARQREDDQAALIHEAKTPLAAMLLALEARENQLSGAGDADTVEAGFLGRLRNELGRLESILERGLFAARADSFADDYLITETDLRQVLSSVAARFAGPLMDRRIAFSLDGEGLVLSDPKWLAFILAQFFSNALKYLPPGSRLTASLFRGERATLLRLADDGPGIPAEDLDRLFERGYSGQRFRSTQSSGMGLYLASRLCGRLGHELTAANGPTGGAEFTIRFPDLPELPYRNVRMANSGER